MSTVTVRLMGGMANQMFQYAAGLSLARLRGAELVLNTHSYRDAPSDRGYMLQAFSVAERTDSAEDKVRGLARMLSRSPAGRGLVDLAARGGRATRYYREPQHCFDPHFYALEAPCSLNGYFQSPLYFSGVEGELRARFAAIPPLSPGAAQALAAIARAPCPVAMHVRGGDYRRQPPGSLLAPLEPGYYEQAVAIMHGLAGREASLFLFTDDPAHARALLPAGVEASVVTTPADRPWEDMHLMSRCRHNITANSSFSWWAAWLNPSPGKVVVGPRQWFTPEGLRRKNICDLYPAGWILV